MARPAAGRHQHDVEAQLLVPEPGMDREEKLERADDARALASQHRFACADAIGARLDLDRGNDGPRLAIRSISPAGLR